MHTSSLLRRALLVAFVVAFVTVGLNVWAQDEGTAADDATMVEEKPLMAVPPGQAIAAAPNDSALIAGEVAAQIAAEQAKISYKIRQSGIGKNFVAGGLFMYPLLLCSIIGLVFIIERLWTISRAHTNVRRLMTRTVRALRENGIQGALEELEKTRGPIAAILHAGLMRSNYGPDAVEKAIDTSGTIEMSFLERGLVAIATVGNVAPLLGFLGTVSGMISAFAAIAAAEQVSAKLVARGIQEALITTATGLIIAIPMNIMHNFFVAQIDRFITEMEEASAELVNELIEIESRSQ